MRYIEKAITKDLTKKMVFVGGPRQCGKTFMAKNILRTFPVEKTSYFNWDDEEHKRDILNRNWDPATKFVVFDELHKFPRWKNWLKGLYDIQKEHHHFYG